MRLARPARSVSAQRHFVALSYTLSRDTTDRLNGVYYFDDLVVLKTATQPALLLEAGIIVNRTDEVTLQQPAVHTKLAAAIATVLARCLRAPPATAFPRGELP